ncbi:hypothetical protein QAD02_013389 [Eretmocerus hayati]|uniref:Uncharacterized protein n=1 Tax=Eretmocerus hayati TaxID=131215 RepID=A0ACC2P2J2_9HYME|nr:hypothetical protein QAD02_013389 [Eretmocerus hayati]
MKSTPAEESGMKYVEFSEESDVIDPCEVLPHLIGIIDNTEIQHEISDGVEIKKENSNGDFDFSEEDDDKSIFEDAQKDDDLEKECGESLRVVNLPRKSSYNLEILGIPLVPSKDERGGISIYLTGTKEKEISVCLVLLEKHRRRNNVDETIDLEKSVHGMMNNPEGWPNYLDFVHKNLGLLGTEYLKNFLFRKNGFDEPHGPLFDGNILKIGRSTKQL